MAARATRSGTRRTRGAGANGDTITTGAGSIDLGASHTAAEFLAPGSGTDTSANDTVVDFSQATGDRILETGLSGDEHTRLGPLKGASLCRSVDIT